MPVKRKGKGLTRQRKVAKKVEETTVVPSPPTEELPLVPVENEERLRFLIFNGTVGMSPSKTQFGHQTEFLDCATQNFGVPQFLEEQKNQHPARVLINRYHIHCLLPLRRSTKTTDKLRKHRKCLNPGSRILSPYGHQKRQHDPLIVNQ
jgi:hypothetical protein